MSRRSHAMLVAVAGLVSACAPAPSFTGVDVVTGQSLAISQRPMPAGRQFSGVYFSPQLGWLWLSERQGKLTGAYRNRSCGQEIRGSAWGVVEQNLARFAWTERVWGSGIDEQRRGEGFAFYSAPPELDRPGQLFGERRTLADGKPAPRRKLAPEFREGVVWTAIGVGAGGLAPDDAERCP